MTDSSSPVVESSSRIVARCEGRPRAALLPNTVTSLVPSAPLRRHERRHDAEEGVARADLEHRPQRLQRPPGGELGQRRLHRLDQVVHGEQMPDVGFGQQQHGCLSGVIISSMLARRL